MEIRNPFKTKFEINNCLFSNSSALGRSDAINQTRGEKAIQFPKFPMNEVAELKKNFPNMSLLVIKDDPKKLSGISSSKEDEDSSKIHTSESPFQTTFETANGKIVQK
jgi:hypothetical protein